MSQIITYRPLCSVNIWHGFYLHDPAGTNNRVTGAEQHELLSEGRRPANYSIFTDLAISPSPATDHLLAGRQIRFRPEPAGFSLWVRAKAVAGGFEPFVAFDTPFNMAFTLELKNKDFLNFTDIETDRSLIYYFSNRAGNQLDGGTGDDSFRFLFLNETRPGFAGNYISAANREQLQSGRMLFEVASLSRRRIGFHFEHPVHPFEIVCTSSSEDSLLESCELDLAGRPAGLYTLRPATGEPEIEGLPRTFYWPGDGHSTAALAVIELFYRPQGLDLGAYDLLDEQQRLRNPTYTLWWANRQTYWRYLFAREQTLEPAANAGLSFEPIVRGPEEHPVITWNTLWTQQPRPLVNRYHPVVFRPDDPNTTSANEEILLPNPDTDRVYPENGEVYSEIYMGDVNLDE